jgi:hypothetical protein
MPTLTAEERAAVSQAVISVSGILQPARQRGTELEQSITSMFAVMNVYTESQAKVTLQVAQVSRCHYLEDFPLYAIRKAAKWTVVTKDKLPGVATFIADVAIGSGILDRRRLLESLK